MTATDPAPTAKSRQITTPTIEIVGERPDEPRDEQPGDHQAPMKVASVSQ